MRRKRRGERERAGQMCLPRCHVPQTISLKGEIYSCLRPARIYTSFIECRRAVAVGPAALPAIKEITRFPRKEIYFIVDVEVRCTPGGNYFNSHFPKRLHIDTEIKISQGITPTCPNTLF